MRLVQTLRRLFGLSGERSPSKPVRFEQRIRINGRCEELYPLVDWRDERHLWRQLGHELREGDDGFTFRIKDLPSTRFEIRVTETIGPSRYSYDSVTLPMLGKLIDSHEEYRFEQLSDGQCEGVLAVDARFVAGLRPRRWRFEKWKMDTSCHNALAKLKLMAEEGLDAVRTASRRIKV